MTKPEIEFPQGPAPTELVSTDLVIGDGDVAVAGGDEPAQLRPAAPQLHDRGLGQRQFLRLAPLGPPPVRLPRDRLGLLGGLGDAAGQHGDTVRGQQVTGLVLEEIHEQAP